VRSGKRKATNDLRTCDDRATRITITLSRSEVVKIRNQTVKRPYSGPKQAEEVGHTDVSLRTRSITPNER